MHDDHGLDEATEGEAALVYDRNRPRLARRLVALVAVTAIALPAAWTYDRRGDDSAELAVGLTTIPTTPVPVTVAPTAAEIPTITIARAPASAPSAPPSSKDLSGLPEIRSAADLGRGSDGADEEPSLEDLPEITAPRSSDTGDGEAADEVDEPTPAPSDAPVADGAADAAPAPQPEAHSLAEPEPRSEAVAEPVAPTETAAPVVAEPTPAPQPTSYSTEDIKQLIRATWPADQVEMALKVAQRESSYNPRDENFCCLGIFQIYYEVNTSYVHRLGYTREDLFDPAANIAVAYALWQDRGWAPWRQTAY